MIFIYSLVCLINGTANWLASTKRKPAGDSREAALVVSLLYSACIFILRLHENNFPHAYACT